LRWLGRRASPGTWRPRGTWGDRGAFWVGAAGLLAVLALAYGYALGLPLFLDDLVHYRWLEAQSLAGVWRSARVIGYYRPLTFTVWKVMRAVLGWYRPGPLHAVNVLLHGANALLVMALLWRRGGVGDRLVGWTAGLLFLLFPFSYQAVAWVGSLSHILATTLTLGALLAHQRGRRAPALVLAGLAPFAHETGVLVAPLLVLLLLTGTERRDLLGALRESAPYWALSAVGLAVWLAVPKDVGQSWVLNLESRWQNAAYLSQGLAFPVAPLARTVLGATSRLNDLGAIALIVAPAVALWAVLLVSAGQGRLAALALGWYGGAAFPAWLVLGFYYVVDGPRLMYGASVGAALFWAAALGALAHRGPGRRTGAVAAGAVGAALAVTGIWVGATFLATRADLYLQMGHVVDGLVRIAEEMPPGERLVAINVPWWIAPREATFALGHEGVTLVPPYTSTGDLLWLHTGEERPVDALVVGRLRQEWRHWLTCDGREVGEAELAEALRGAGAVAVVSGAGRDLAVRDAGGLAATERAPGEAWLADFGGLRLVGVQAVREEGGLRVTLTWACLAPPDEDVTVFLHVLDDAGALVGQRDGYPLAGAAPPAFWQPGDVWRDVRQVELRKGTDPASLRLGLYRPADGARVAARDAAGAPLPDDALTVSLPSGG
jgi:hypothetical protein